MNFRLTFILAVSQNRITGEGYNCSNRWNLKNDNRYYNLPVGILFDIKILAS